MTPAYPVLCRCGAPAAYKVAARWSDGVTEELKTYGVACPACVRRLWADAARRQAGLRLTPGEAAGAPEVYDLAGVRRDRAAARRPGLESDGPG